MKTRFASIGLALILALLALVLLISLVAAGPGDPDPGTVYGIATYTFYSEPVTGTGTVYSSRSVPAYNYHSLDVFITADVSGTAAITVVPQLSADNTNWATATYSYVGTPLSYATTFTSTDSVTATTTSTSTATVTGTMTTNGSTTATGTPTVYEANYQVVLDADESDYFRMAMTGYYIRFKISYTGTVTPLIRAVLRND